MKLLGNKNCFAIEYKIKPMPSGMNTTWDDWGCLYFWVNNRNLFAFKNSIPSDTYHWHLFYLVQWFCDNLIYIMDEDDYPSDVKGKNTFDILDNFDLFHEKLDVGSEEYGVLRDIRLNWGERRRIYEAAGASFLPDLFLRAVNGKIEIQWDNSVLYENRPVKLLYELGLEYVDQKEFFLVVSEFCKELLDHLEKQHSLEDLRASLERTIQRYGNLVEI